MTDADALRTNGYCVVPHRKAIDDVAALEGRRVRYLTTAAQVTRLMDWLRDTRGIDLHALKFRASNNNNNVDASQPHRDVKVLGNKFENVYTVLYYVDDADLEVYLGSHRGKFAALSAKAKRIQLSAGDMVIFHSSMLHRGIYSDCRCAKDNRRVLQMFDCVADKALHARIHNRISGDKRVANSAMDVLSRRFPQILVGVGMYINGVVPRRVAYSLAGIPAKDMISFEGNVPRIRDTPTTRERATSGTCSTRLPHDIVGRQSVIVTAAEAGLFGDLFVLLLVVAMLLWRQQRRERNFFGSPFFFLQKKRPRQPRPSTRFFR